MVEHQVEQPSEANILSDEDLEASYIRGGPTHAELLRDRAGRILRDERLAEYLEARATVSEGAAWFPPKRAELLAVATVLRTGYPPKLIGK